MTKKLISGSYLLTISDIDPKTVEKEYQNNGKSKRKTKKRNKKKTAYNKSPQRLNINQT